MSEFPSWGNSPWNKWEKSPDSEPSRWAGGTPEEVETSSSRFGWVDHEAELPSDSPVVSPVSQSRWVPLEQGTSRSNSTEKLELGNPTASSLGSAQKVWTTEQSRTWSESTDIHSIPAFVPNLSALDQWHPSPPNEPVWASKGASPPPPSEYSIPSWMSSSPSQIPVFKPLNSKPALSVQSEEFVPNFHPTQKQPALRPESDPFVPSFVNSTAQLNPTSQSFVPTQSAISPPQSIAAFANAQEFVPSQRQIDQDLVRILRHTGDRVVLSIGDINSRLYLHVTLSENVEEVVAEFCDENNLSHSIGEVILHTISTATPE